MIKVLFVCHGNICRSPMAEFIFKYMVKKTGKRFEIASAATHTDAIGSSVHHGTKNKLKEKGIPFTDRRATQLKHSDKYDYYIGMDRHNIANMRRILGQDHTGEIRRLLDYTNNPRDVADPWYTHDFETCYNDIYQGLEAFLKEISAKQ